MSTIVAHVRTHALQQAKWERLSPQYYPHLYIPSRMGCIAAGAAGAGIEMLMGVVQLTVHPSFGWLDVVCISFDALVVGCLVWLLMYMSRQRRLVTAHHLRAIADANHHIRNALQAISMEQAVRCPNKINGACIHDDITVHVERIKWVLEVILPDLIHHYE